MDIFNINNLALGGAVAAIAGFWNQFKNSVRYLSSFLVIQVTYDVITSSAVLNYLKVEYKTVPSGLVNVFSIGAFINPLKSWRQVPFRMINSTAVFYRGGQFLVTNISGDTLRLYGIRGTFDFKILTSRALDHQQALWDNVNNSSSRFFIEKVIGSDKGSWSAALDRRPQGDANITSQAPQDSSSSTVCSLLYPSISVDTSFKYQTADYRLVASDDPFQALFFDDDVTEHVREAKQWLHAKQWYAERAIPWKRGWLIHGPGGTGKSSLSLALAKAMNVPIYQFFLATLSDQEFIREWGRMQVPCFALCEDFDTVFDKRTSLTEHKSLTFDCVLNVISGVSAIDGVFLIVTTNHIDKIDEALGVVSKHGSISTRPGRIDQVIHLGHTTVAVRRRQVQHILRDWPESHERLVREGDGMTPVQFQEKCLGFAYSRLSELPTRSVP